MKTNRLPRFISVIVLFIALMAIPTAARAQANCPYTINNNLACTITINYTIFSSSCGWYSNTVTIPPGGNYIIQCWEFPGGCETADIELLLTQVDNTGFICKPPYSNGVASNSQYANAGPLFPGVPCSTINMIWTPSGCSINP